MVSSFLVLHALLHLALALTLSTGAYLTARRVVSWATLGVGALCLYGFLSRLRRHQAETHANPDVLTTPRAGDLDVGRTPLPRHRDHVIRTPPIDSNGRGRC